MKKITGIVNVKPNIFVSKCLGFAKCRWDGEMARDRFVEMMKPYVNFVAMCPECEIGLGIPRNKIRIVLKNRSYRLMQLNTGKDLTGKMNAFVSGYVHSLGDIDGFILKDRSPSCGIKNVKVYPGLEAAAPIGRTSGFFSRKILQNFPGAAIETEARLSNPAVRKDFLLKIFTSNSERYMRSNKRSAYRK